ncbi:hypothetical protein DFH08DRAFT_813071 [Mycena albidolilacea]|uniref:Uncharacterized protein n=1 Tax=Mycena albidolilacea TaxID=1033008 RepID=A0AAD6ZS06_9AGAR|nr:hypothetical protein DFH08DRAFT_813071 [Mycena albidolilacea]
MPKVADSTEAHDGVAEHCRGTPVEAVERPGTGPRRRVNPSRRREALRPKTYGSKPTTDGIVLAQLVGIAPTIIAVRVALGQSVENVNSFVVPRPRMHSNSPFHHETAVTAMDSVDDEVLYIRPESVKVEAV